MNDKKTQFPLDNNLIPIGCLQAGTSWFVTATEPLNISDSGVYRVLCSSGNGVSYLSVDYPDGTRGDIYYITGTIEYIYIPKGSVVTAHNGEYYLTIML